MQRALGALCDEGVAVDWDGYFASEMPRRISLPTYPFERKRFWASSVDAKEEQEASTAGNRVEEAAVIDVVTDKDKPKVVESTPSRRTGLTSSVAALLQKLSGMDAEELNPLRISWNWVLIPFSYAMTQWPAEPVWGEANVSSTAGSIHFDRRSGRFAFQRDLAPGSSPAASAMPGPGAGSRRFSSDSDEFAVAGDHPGRSRTGKRIAG